jgi:hypothetical protein
LRGVACGGRGREGDDTDADDAAPALPLPCARFSNGADEGEEAAAVAEDAAAGSVGAAAPPETALPLPVRTGGSGVVFFRVAALRPFRAFLLVVADDAPPPDAPSADRVSFGARPNLIS